MSALRSITATIGVVVILGLGFGSWALIAPGEAQRRELLRDLPEADPHRMDESRRRTALVLQTLKESAETNENIARSR